MKKNIGVIIIAIVSSLMTVLTVNHFTKNDIATYSSGSGLGSSKFAFTNNSGARMSLPDFTQAAESTVNAVVHVHNYQEGRQGGANPNDIFEWFFGNGQGPRQQMPQQGGDKQEYLAGSGSGVIISSDGYIVTNNHVVEQSDKLKVTLNDGKEYNATLIGKDPNTDIALIKIEGSNFHHLTFSNSDQVKVGEWVLAVGNPFNLTSTVTAGIVSATGRNIDILRQNRSANNTIESFIQTDAVVNPGNSGGALVNTNGDLIGINTAISTHTGVYEGYSFAVPANLAKKVVEDLLEYGMVQRAYLGIEIVDLSNEQNVEFANKQNNLDLKTGHGVYIINFPENSSAAKTGIKKGDIITEVAGKEIKGYDDLKYILGKKRPGETVEVKVDRGGSEKTYQIKLTNKKGTDKLISKEDLSIDDILGVQTTKLDKKSQTDLGITYGVKVTNVDTNGLFAKAEIQPGDIILTINNTKINSQKDITTLVDKLNDGDLVYIKLVRNGYLDDTGFTFSRN